MNNFQEAIDVDKVFMNNKTSDEEREQGIEAIRKIVSDIESARSSANGTIPTGLIYGRIQSGKTRTMVLASALAIDRGTKVIVVLTSNNNDLVEQTYDAFKSGLPGVKVISKSELNDMAVEIDLLKATLPATEGSVVIVCSKDPRLLQTVNLFLQNISAENYPAIIFDDEGDQATLDTNMARRARTSEDLSPSRIYSLINDEGYASLRRALPGSVFVSVTGTPQALLLQNSGSDMRPAFITLTSPGRGYVGGEVFFEAPRPESNKYVSIVGEDEVSILLDDPETIPDGLISAINFFVVAAAVAGLERGWNSYNMLAHPSLSRFDHALVKQKIVSYVNHLITTLSDPKSKLFDEMCSNYSGVFDEIKSRRVKELGFDFNDVFNAIKQKLPQRQLFVINSDRTGQSQSPSRSYNFLIGGNSVGRGLAIPNLLVTYYTRSPRIVQMDTMHQHARMYGYRKGTLPYTKIFLPNSLYARFYWINESDLAVRDYIRTKGDDLANIIIPTNSQNRIRPTRGNVLDMNNVDVILPGSQIHPGIAVYESPFAERVLSRTNRLLLQFDPQAIKKAETKVGLIISAQQAIDLISAVGFPPATKRTLQAVIDYVDFLGKSYDDKIRLRMREAPKRQNKYSDGILPSGIVGGPSWKEAKEDSIPTFWIFKVTGKEKYKWSTSDFYYPTIITPNQEQSLYCNIIA